MSETGEPLGKIPATVVTGFLGSGKTTLIRHLLQNAGGRRIALIINEFGDVGVDGDLLKGCGEETCGEDDVVELANGCICCTVADDFLPTMQRLLERRPLPDHIVIETSGLALPKPLVKAFNWPEIRTRVTVGGVITLVDSAALAEGRFASDEAAVDRQRQADEMLDHESPLEELFEDQLLCADMVIMNKADLVAPEKLDQLEDGLREEVRSSVKFLRSENAAVSTDVLLGLSFAVEEDLDARPSHHDAEGDHDHDDFESFVVEAGEIADAGSLANALRPVLETHDILRLKGFAAVEGSGMRLAVQAVGPRIQHYFDRDWQDGEARRSRFVVIGEKGIDKAETRDALREAIG
ncbi:cobalamin biosynthesis protein CobW [Parvibaculum sp. MBR-TMA-1.3b-4.2]|jgi:cobalamin biosynthesis protein CobW